MGTANLSNPHELGEVEFSWRRGGTEKMNRCKLDLRDGLIGSLQTEFKATC
jgi:hypothetical protein